MYSFEEALDEIVIGQVAYDDDRHGMALYAIQQFRILREYLPKEKHHEMAELIIAFNLDKITETEFRVRAEKLKN